MFTGNVYAKGWSNPIECDVWGGGGDLANRETPLTGAMLSICATKDVISSNNMSMSLFSKGIVSPMVSADSSLDASISLGGRIKFNLLDTAYIRSTC